MRGAIGRSQAWAVGLSTVGALVVAGAMSVFVAEGAGIVEVAVGGVPMITIVAVTLYRAVFRQLTQDVRGDSGELVLGTDGLRWTPVDGEAIYVPWPEVGDVTVRYEEAVVARKDHPPIHIRTGGGKKIARVIAEGKAAYDARVPAQIPLALGDLRRSRAATEADYRAGAEVDPDVLVRVIEDPLAPPLTRLDAALRLPESAQAARARVRVALDDVLSPTTRVALEASLDGKLDDAHIEALEALEVAERAAAEATD